jgi:hypothetical protein
MLAHVTPTRRATVELIKGGSLAERTWHVAVSFLRTPFAEISSRIQAIQEYGWSVEHRGDPWVVSFSKSLPEEFTEPETELRRLMGEEWLGADDIRRLLGAAAPLG